MKKNIAYIIIALLSTVVVSCTKDADVDAVEKKLPPMSISSFGLAPNLTSPFANTNTLNFVFGASTTNTETGTFDLAFYETAVVNKVTVYTFADSIHFEKWSGKDATEAFTIGAKNIPTTYPNTSVYQGTITWKLNATKFLSGKKYSVRAYIRPKGVTSTYTPYQLKIDNLITIK